MFSSGTEQFRNQSQKKPLKNAKALADQIANSEYIIDPIYNIALADLTNRFWRIKNSPPLAAAFRDLSHMENIGRIKNSPPLAAAFRDLSMENIGTFRILQVENGPSSIRFQPEVCFPTFVPQEGNNDT
ncbi:hypothetical protein QE152_g9720 [Popillia japonica]|uniref:Uncharacterized protein n=1 Tax=Popillia japonica TaxID=7064 RepID=A0AAW1LWL9_POPJA